MPSEEQPTLDETIERVKSTPRIMASKVLGELESVGTAASEAAHAAQDARAAVRHAEKMLENTELQIELGSLPVLAKLIDHMTGDVELADWEVEKLIEKGRGMLREAGTVVGAS